MLIFRFVIPDYVKLTISSKLITKSSKNAIMDYHVKYLDDFSTRGKK